MVRLCRDAVLAEGYLSAIMCGCQGWALPGFSFPAYTALLKTGVLVPGCNCNVKVSAALPSFNHRNPAALHCASL